jgi:hypothetical protein
MKVRQSYFCAILLLSGRRRNKHSVLHTESNATTNSRITTKYARWTHLLSFGEALGLSTMTRIQMGDDNEISDIFFLADELNIVLCFVCLILEPKSSRRAYAFCECLISTRHKPGG